MSLYRIVFIISLTFGIGFAGCSKQNQLEDHLAEGQAFFDAGDYDSAEVAYRNVLRIDPTNATAISQLGIMLFDQGRLLPSAPLLTRAKELDPDNVPARFRLALAHLSIRDVATARQEIEHVLELDPAHPDAPLTLLDTIASPDEAKEVRAKLEGMRDAGNTSIGLEMALAALDLRENKADEAFEKFKALTEKAPDYVPAHAVYGALAGSRGDLALAETELKRAADLSPARSTRRLQYAQFLIQKGDTAAGKAYIEEMTRKTPDYLPAWLHLAQMAASEQDFENSRTLVGRVLSRDAAHPDGLLLSARIYLAQGDHEKGIVELERALKVFPNSPQFLYQLALAQVAAGDTVKALGSVTQALAMAPAYPEAALLQADLSARNGDLNGAIVTLRKLVEQRPGTIQGWLMLGQAFRAQGSFAEALQVYNEIERLFPDHPQTPLLKGQVLMQQNKAEEARAAFSESLDRAPDSLAVVEQLINVDLAERKVDSAMSRVDAAIEKHPDIAPLQIIRAKVLTAAGRLDEAEAALQKSIELAPDSPTTYGMLAAFYLATKRQEEALTTFTEVVARNPRDVRAWMMIGMLRQNQQKHKEALEAYEKLLEIEPRFPVALNNAAYLYSEEFNDLDKALAAAQKARELQPHDPSIADTLGWIAFKRGQYTWAMSLLQESAEKLPQNAEVQYHLGMVHYMMGAEEVARTAFQKAIDLNKSFNGIEDARGRLELLEIDPAQATSSDRARIEQALEARPEDPIALVRLGVLHERAGDMKAALAAYTGALKTNPDNIDATLRLIHLSLSQNDAKKALELARNARRLAPENGDVTHALGRAAYATGDYRWSHSLLQEAARKLNRDGNVVHDLAWAAYATGNVSEAETAFEEALSAAPSASWAPRATTALDLIRLVSDANALSNAASRIQQVLDQDPKNVPALIAAATLAEQRDDRREAVKSYLAALERFPEFAPAKERLAILYAENAENDALSEETQTGLGGLGSK